MVEIMLIVTLNTICISWWIKTDVSFWNTRNVKISIQGTQYLTSQLNSATQVNFVRLRYWCRKSSRWLPRKRSKKMEIDQYWWHFLDLSHTSHSDSKIKILDFPTEIFFRKTRVSIKTSMEELKVLVSETPEFESRQEITYYLSRVSRRSGTWHMDENERFPVQIFHYKSDVFDQTLIKETKPVNAETKVFEYRVISKMTALFGTFELSGVWRKARNRQFFVWVLLY